MLPLMTFDQLVGYLADGCEIQLYVWPHLANSYHILDFRSHQNSRGHGTNKSDPKTNSYHNMYSRSLGLS